MLHALRKMGWKVYSNNDEYQFTMSFPSGVYVYVYIWPNQIFKSKLEAGGMYFQNYEEVTHEKYIIATEPLHRLSEPGVRVEMTTESLVEALRIAYQYCKRYMLAYS